MKRQYKTEISIFWDILILKKNISTGCELFSFFNFWKNSNSKATFNYDLLDLFIYFFRIFFKLSTFPSACQSRWVGRILFCLNHIPVEHSAFNNQYFAMGSHFTGEVQTDQVTRINALPLYGFRRIFHPFSPRINGWSSWKEGKLKFWSLNLKWARGVLMPLSLEFGDHSNAQNILTFASLW